MAVLMMVQDGPELSLIDFVMDALDSAWFRHRKVFFIPHDFAISSRLIPREVKVG